MQIAAPLRSVVEACLSRNAQQRPNMLTVADSIAELLDNAPTEEPQAAALVVTRISKTVAVSEAVENLRVGHVGRAASRGLRMSWVIAVVACARF